ncbi:hypothetical protein GQ44DRAFT_755122 [Phaeosphaeriaceae sp. PMI808]|nr:hypothetical protein GQ44DRAFT_755122 [Phaeosphaeriaceae sp. PMI808]
MRSFTYFISSTARYLLPAQQQVVGNLDTIPETFHGNSVDPCSLAESSNVNASIQLASWLECQINGRHNQISFMNIEKSLLGSFLIILEFYPFPENTNWQKNHAIAFSKDLRFTFNDTHYDFDGSLRLYQSFNATLGRAFAPFKHGFINTLGIPNYNGDRGGFVYMIGWAGGFQKFAKRDMYFTNAAFAVIKEESGVRKIAEFRESSNIPNTAKIPEQTVWDCHFPKERNELKV